MTFVYLIQHAEARTEEEDPQRSLSDDGKVAIEKMAAWAGRHVRFNLKTIRHSGKKRAEQTAEILAKHLQPADGIVVNDGLQPMDDPAIWAKRLETESDDTMLVGHLPHMKRLAAVLLCGIAEVPAIEFQNAGIVCLQRSDFGDWSLRWMVVPELL